MVRIVQLRSSFARAHVRNVPHRFASSGPPEQFVSERGLFLACQKLDLVFPAQPGFAQLNEQPLLL